MPDYIFLIFYQRFLQLLKGKNYYFKKSCTAYFFSICLKTSDKRNENYVHTQTRDVYRLRGIATDGRTVDGQTQAYFSLRSEVEARALWYIFVSEKKWILFWETCEPCKEAENLCLFSMLIKWYWIFRT